MAGKYVSLSIIDSIDKESADILLTKPINILCKNFETEQQEIIKLDDKYKKNGAFWKLKNSKWVYYIKEDDILQYTNLQKSTEEFFGFTSNYNEILKMSPEKKLEALISQKDKLKQVELKRDKTNEEISDVVTKATQESIMLNKAIFDDLMKLTPEKAKLKSKNTVDETSEIVKIAYNLLTDFSGDYSIFANMIEKSNGSTIKHMTRVFVITMSFFKYYNYLINSGYASKVRVNFISRYRKHYERLIPHEQDYNLITLERVFLGGMSAVSEMESNAIGVGFLLHDIGKQVDIEYFEGSMGYVRERIEAHVKNGFNELLKRTVYPPVVSAIAGFHHEYYGNSSGYGSLRDYINSKFPNGVKSNHCISYTLKDVYNGQALCFFPAKMLELVDIYDALTDPERKYRAPFTPKEALLFIDEKFIQEEVKVDPILFDMFKLYLDSVGELK